MKPDQPAAGVRRRDELLELLYWIEGEGFAGAARLASLARFLTHSESEVAEVLAVLVQRGDVETVSDRLEYRLTESGRREAARRFADEFAPLLAQGHGACNDPNCDCHTDPSLAAECHARHSGR